MTKKRFQYNVNKNSIEYDGKHFAYCNGGQSKIAKKLNVLQKENEELKQKVDFYKYFQKDARELEKENEQLKKVIAENEKLIQSTYDELTKLRCIKKNLGRIKTQWDWIMEAIQYD